MTRSLFARQPWDGDPNTLYPEDEVVHGWYRFVLSFPPQLVQDCIGRFELGDGQHVLDPFCGTGTTLVECKKRGIASVGLERTPMGHFATQTKTDWSPDPEGLLEHATHVADAASSETENTASGQLRALPPEAQKALLKDSISPLPLHRTLVLLETLGRQRDDRYHRHELLALAKALPTQIGNLRFGPEVGVGAKKEDAPVVEAWLRAVRVMVADLREVGGQSEGLAVCHRADARDVMATLEPDSVDAVITSPPYPNEKDYTRIMRLEMVILGFVQSMKDLQAMKQELLCSNTRNVYKASDDDRWAEEYAEVQEVADEIEERRAELGKTSGFERLYGRVVRLYFGGMRRHLASLRAALRPGAQLAYVVGDQASYFRIMIRTGKLLANIAESLGYELLGIELFRTRLATATKEQLREEIVFLRWPGGR